MIERYREIKRQKAAGEREEGFTLIELLIVIVVLGILAAVVIFALGGVTGESAQAACNADAKTVETAVAAFEAQQPGVIPAASAGAGTAASPATDTALTAAANGFGPYLHTFPNNPTAGYSISVDATGAVQITTPAGGATTTPYDSQTATAGCSQA